MQLDKTQIALPRAWVTLSGERVNPSAVSIKLGVDTFPSATVHFYNNGNRARLESPVSEDMTSKVGADQTAMFEGAENAKIYVNDGLAGDMRFDGYITNTTYNITAGGIGQATSIAHPSAILNTLNTGIYNQIHGIYRYPSEFPKGDKYFGSWMKNTLEYMIEGWESYINNANDIREDSKNIMLSIHENNKDALDAWYEVCSQSSPSTPLLEKFVDQPDLQKSLKDKIQQIYMSSYGGFFNVMQQFAAQFQMMFIPNVFDSEGVGWFRSISDVLEVHEEREVYIRQMSLSAGDANILPVTAVVVHGNTKAIWRSPGIPSGAPLSMFPTEVQGGRLQRLTAPGWLPIYNKGLSNAAQGKQPPNLGAYKSGKEIVDKKIREVIDKDVLKVIDDYARTHYIDLTLSGSQATITTPLDLSWEIGKTYQLTTGSISGSGSGKKLFKGFLYSVTHNVSSAEQSPQANTKLMFTHVRAGDFALPGIT